MPEKKKMECFSRNCQQIRRLLLSPQTSPASGELRPSTLSASAPTTSVASLRERRPIHCPAPHTPHPALSPASGELRLGAPSMSVTVLAELHHRWHILLCVSCSTLVWEILLCVATGKSFCCAKYYSTAVALPLKCCRCLDVFSLLQQDFIFVAVVSNGSHFVAI